MAFDGLNPVKWFTDRKAVVGRIWKAIPGPDGRPSATGSPQGDGALIVSPVAHRPSLERMGVPTGSDLNVGTFSSGQRRFLEYHRDAVLLQAVR